MFTPEEMAKVRILCSKSDEERVVRALYDFGAIEVRRSNAVPPSNKPLPEFQQISERLVELRAFEKKLEEIKTAGMEAVAESAADVPSSCGSERLLRESAKIPFAELKKLEGRLSSALEEKGNAEARARGLAPFKGLDVRPSLLKGGGRLRYAYFLLKEGAADGFRKALKGLNATALLVEGEGGGNYALIAFDKTVSEEKGSAVVAKHAARVFAIPEIEGESFGKAFEEAANEAGRAGEKARRTDAELAEFKKKFFATASGLRKALEAKGREAELAAQFGAGGMFLNVEGWIPKKLLHELRTRMERELKGSVEVETIATAERAPVLLKNPRLVKPFEFLVKFFSMPGEGELDPTILISLSFPIFFGMILGDVGYGFAALLLALLMRAKFERGFFRSVAGMMLLSAISTIFFGFVYAEFFGMEEIFGYRMHPLIGRAEAEGLELLMGLCLVAGFLHIAVGFMIGAVTAVREKHWKHAFAKIGWLSVEMGLVSFLTLSADVVFFRLFAPYAAFVGKDASLIAALVGLVAIVVFEGATGLLELPGLFANLFSYLRIMALGVSGVIFALIVDKIPLATPSLDVASIASFVLFALVFVSGHAIGLALGMFEASIQSLRLHYVEFFSKFYKGGGIPFAPLREDRLNGY